MLTETLETNSFRRQRSTQLQAHPHERILSPSRSFCLPPLHYLLVFCSGRRIEDLVILTATAQHHRKVWLRMQTRALLSCIAGSSFESCRVHLAEIDGSAKIAPYPRQVSCRPALSSVASLRVAFVCSGSNASYQVRRFSPYKLTSGRHLASLRSPPLLRTAAQPRRGCRHCTFLTRCTSSNCHFGRRAGACIPWP